MPPGDGIDIEHEPDRVAKADACEQVVYTQFQYVPESGVPTVNIPTQSPVCGLDRSAKVNVDVEPLATIDGLALIEKPGVGVTVGVDVCVLVSVGVAVGAITVMTFEVPLLVSVLAA